MIHQLQIKFSWKSGETSKSKNTELFQTEWKKLLTSKVHFQL